MVKTLLAFFAPNRYDYVQRAEKYSLHQVFVVFTLQSKHVNIAIYETLRVYRDIYILSSFEFLSRQLSIRT